MPESTSCDFVSICSPGSQPMCASELSAAGFKVSTSRAMYDPEGVDVGALNCLPELYSYCRNYTRTTPFENKLRSAYAKMLHDYADTPYNTVFAEDDACPSPGVTREWLDGLLTSPAVGLYDVVMLGTDRTHPPCVKLPAQNGECIVEVGQLYRAVMGSNYTRCRGRHTLMYGTQAVWVRPEARGTLEECIRRIIAPTDTLMFHVGMTGTLRVGKCTSNLFYQKFHTNSHQ